MSNLDELNTTIVITHDIESSILISDTIWLIGRDYDEQGQPIPGAKVKYKYDLIERGLAWRKGIENTPEFFELSKELKQKFNEL